MAGGEEVQNLAQKDMENVGNPARGKKKWRSQSTRWKCKKDGQQSRSRPMIWVMKMVKQEARISGQGKRCWSKWATLHQEFVWATTDSKESTECEHAALQRPLCLGVSVFDLLTDLGPTERRTKTQPKTMDRHKS